MRWLHKKYILLLYIIPLILLHIYAYRIWFFSSSILTHGDWFLSLPEHSKELFSLPTIWTTYLNGSVNLTPPFYIFLLFEGIFSNMGISYSYIERILFMWPIALFTLPLSYMLIKSITKSTLSSIISAMFYTYNTYFIIIQTGHLTLMMGYSLAPLAILLFSRALERSKLIYVVLTSIVFFIISVYEFRSFYLVAIVCLLYSIYFFLFIKSKLLSSSNLIIVLRIISIFVITLLLNFYWIFPLFTITKSENGPFLSRGLFGNDFFSLIRAFTLFHPFWTGGRYFPFIVQKIPVYFYLLPIIAFAGLFLSRKNKKIIFFGLISLLGIFFTKQSYIPFSNVYLFLYNTIPGFSLFREASKFYFLIALGYSVLIGSFVNWLLGQHRRKILSKKITGHILLGGIFIIAVLNLKPLINGEIGTLFSERVMPKDYKTFNSFINEQNMYFQTLWVPTDSRWASYTDLHPKIPLAVAQASNWKDIFIYELDKYNYPSDIQFLKNKKTNILLDIAAVKYVVLPIQDNLNDDDFFPNYGRRDVYEQELNKINYLRKIDIGTKDLDIYINKNYKPKLYISDEMESFYKVVTIKNVKYNRITSTKYKLYITSKLNEYLHFSENYHPDWKLYSGDMHWTKAALRSSGEYPDSFHKKNPAGFNSYYLKAETICRLTKCIALRDGNYKLELTLFFKPQAYMYLGSIVSFSTLSILLSYLLFYILKHFKNYFYFYINNSEFKSEFFYE